MSNEILTPLLKAELKPINDFYAITDKAGVARVDAANLLSRLYSYFEKEVIKNMNQERRKINQGI